MRAAHRHVIVQRHPKIGGIREESKLKNVWKVVGLVVVGLALGFLLALVLPRRTTSQELPATRS